MTNQLRQINSQFGSIKLHDRRFIYETALSATLVTFFRQPWELI